MAHRVRIGTRVIEADAGTPLRDLILRSDILLDFPCGGRGTCGQCRVSVDPPEAAQGDREGDLLLACQASLVSDATISIPEHRVGGSEWQGAAATGEAAVSEHETLLKRRQVKIPPPSLEDQRSDWNRVSDALRGNGLTLDSPAQESLENLSAHLRANGWTANLLLEDSGYLCCYNSPDDRFFGMAIDLGTTTVDVALYDMESSVRVGRRTLFNRQAAYGADVITRTQAFQSDRGAVRAAALETIEQAAQTLLQEAGVAPRQVVRSVVVGNPIMIHILHDLNPLQLTQAPYIPLVTDAVRRSPRDFGWTFQRYGFVETLPLISAYVGGDTTAVIVSLDLVNEKNTVLAVDVGTNGEIVLSKGGALFATSAAAGPAFEGAQISCGSRAVPGAIMRVRIAPEHIDTEVLGDGRATGICGTALIMAVAGMLQTGLVDETGRLATATDAPSGFLASRLFDHAGQPAFALVEDQTVYVSQKDIRELQLAKGAIRTAIESLLDETRTPWSEVERVHLAGNFGAGMSVDAEMRIGLLPDIDLSRVNAVGNAALRGAALALMSAPHREMARRVATDCTFIELAGRPDFQMRFADAMMF